MIGNELKMKPAHIGKRAGKLIATILIDDMDSIYEEHPAIELQKLM